jgi:hypothetical protein
MTTAESYVVGLAAIVVIVALLWRRIESIGKMTAVLWVIMILTLLSVIVAAYTHFHAGQVLTFPAPSLRVRSTSPGAASGSASRAG